jgi:hypothetical protein
MVCASCNYESDKRKLMAQKYCAYGKFYSPFHTQPPYSVV